MATLMFIDNVLRSQVTNAPISQGLKLYRTLKDRDNRVLLLCTDKAKDDRWLKENKINLVDDLVGRDIPLPGENPEFRQVEHCRANWSIDMVITADPELATLLLQAGITTLMFLHPVYITEKFRPDSRQGVKPWAEITKEIIKQQESFVEDHRIQ